MTLWPDEPLALQQAAVCLALSDPGRAIELQRRVVASPRRLECSTPSFFLAVWAFRAGDKATAVPAARTALREDQLSDDLRVNLIDKLAAVDPAIAEAESIAWLERQPKSCPALVLRARQLLTRNERDAAEALLAEALAQPVAAPEVHAQFALLQSQLGRHEEGMATARRVLAAIPHHVELHLALLTAAKAAADAEAALAEQRRWLGVQPLDANGWRELAVMLQSQPDGAREALAAVSRADWLTSGKDRKVLLLRADLHEALGEKVAAQLCREQAGKLPPGK
jgi:tetratricopeptide (TPR) repeat protein